MKDQELKEKMELLRNNIEEGIKISLKGGATGVFTCAKCKREKHAGAILKKEHETLCVDCFLQIAEQKLAKDIKF